MSISINDSPIHCLVAIPITPTPRTPSKDDSEQGKDQAQADQEPQVDGDADIHAGPPQIDVRFH